MANHKVAGVEHPGVGEDCGICWPDGSEANKPNPTPGQIPRGSKKSRSSIFIATDISEYMEVKLRRTALGMTQWQVAAAASVAPWAVSAYERNDRYVPPSWIRKIRASLGLDNEL